MTMPVLLFQKKQTDLSTPIANEFILQQMPAANGNYVKVYLYVFFHFYQSQVLDSGAQIPEFSTKITAETLGLLESDVMQALQYWHNQKALTLSQNGEQLWLSFPSEHTAPPTDPAKHNDEQPAKVVRVEHKPTYSPEEIGMYQENPTIQDLFSTASHLLGEPLSFPNLSILFSFYDYYRLPVDVIKFLMQYCVQGGNRSLRYMEKVAQDWSDHNITTLDAALTYVKRFDVYRPIMKCLSISDRKPSENEIEYMERWIYQYGFSLEIVQEAATRTLQKTGKSNFKYMDSILKAWHEQGVRTFQDIARCDEAFAAQRSAAGDPSSTAKTPKGNFHTYMKRSNLSYADIEKRAQELLHSDDNHSSRR